MITLLQHGLHDSEFASTNNIQFVTTPAFTHVEARWNVVYFIVHRLLSKNRSYIDSKHFISFAALHRYLFVRKLIKNALVKLYSCLWS